MVLTWQGQPAPRKILKLWRSAGLNGVHEHKGQALASSSCSNRFVAVDELGANSQYEQWHEQVLEFRWFPSTFRCSRSAKRPTSPKTTHADCGGLAPRTSASRQPVLSGSHHGGRG
jgi:hypothetical protein